MCKKRLVFGLKRKVFINNSNSKSRLFRNSFRLRERYDIYYPVLDKQTIALQIMEELIEAESCMDSITFQRCKYVAKFVGKMEFLAIANPYISPFLDRLRKDMNSVVVKRVGEHL